MLSAVHSIRTAIEEVQRVVVAPAVVATEHEQQIVH
jgi:hypothetical protein